MSENSFGFVGLGALGLPIAANLLRAGHSLKVYARKFEQSKFNKLKAAKFCKSAEEAAIDSNVFFICVSDDKAVEEVLFSSEGAYKSLEKGSIVIDLSTISPSKARSISKRLAEKNIEYCDAPVSGGTEGAEEGTLTMFLGCNIQTIERVRKVIKSIASNIYCFGKVGKGQEVKAINQILVAGSYMAVAEAISLGEALELPMDIVIEALQKGAASSWALTHRSKAMLEDNYPLGFKLALHHKDLSIALNTAEETGLTLPITKKVREIEKSLIRKGYGDHDVSVIKRFLLERCND